MDARHTEVDAAPQRMYGRGKQHTMAANMATSSAGKGELDWSRKRRDTSSRGMASRPHERQMDTALVDQADWKLSLGPTCAARQAAEMPSVLLMHPQGSASCHSRADCHVAHEALRVTMRKSQSLSRKGRR